MEAQTARLPSASGPSSDAYPRWVMLEPCCYSSRRIDVGNSSSSTAGDEANTLAAARTSAGHLIQVSLHLAEPPATSSVCVQQDPDRYNCMVLAAHGDSVLILARARENHGRCYGTDHFVYNAGDANADPPRPPSLSRLPPLHQYDEEEGILENRTTPAPPPMETVAFATGLVRRGEDEIVVAGLRTAKLEDTKTTVAELCVFRSGEWSVQRVPLSFGGGDDDVWDELLPSVWHAVLPVGDRQLCWVHVNRGGLVIRDDVFEESPRLQYLRLPVDPCLSSLPSSRNVCATAGGRALKFVNVVVPSGGAGALRCERSLRGYTIHTWMLRMDGMEWVKDGIVDAAELWELNAYIKGLPRALFECPVVSWCEPNVVYFQLRESWGQDAPWILKVDTRSKTIQWFRGDGISCL